MRVAHETNALSVCDGWSVFSENNYEPQASLLAGF